MTGYGFVLLTVLLTVYGQLALKWQVAGAGTFPESTGQRILFLARLLLNPWVISAFVAAFMASMSWMAAMTKLQLSHAYPFMALNFVLVLVLSAMLFEEPVSVPKVVGLGLIVVGIAVSSQG